MTSAIRQTSPIHSQGTGEADRQTASASSQDQSSRDAELRRLRSEVADLRIALHTSNEHGDLLQEHLYHLSTSLEAEVRERQAAEQKLQKLLHAVTREKADLEILVQILIDQGDDWAEEGGKARVDALTQLANRRRFDEYLSQEWKSHRRLQQPLSLLVCDVDHFKLYNDYYGHQAGDECLKAVAGAISCCIRAECLAARYGGEEFAIVLPHTDFVSATRVAERVRLAVAAAALPHAASTICDRVTLSIGVACRTPAAQGVPDARALLEEADQFLYLAKRRGRNCVAYQREEDQNR